MKLRHRLAAIFILGALLASAVLAVLATRVAKGISRDSAERRLASEAELLAADLRRVQDPRDRLLWVAETAVRLGARVTVISEEGALLADSALTSAAELATAENQAQKPEVASARVVGRGSDIRISPIVKDEFLFVARRIGEGPGTGFVRLALPTRDVGRFDPGYVILVTGCLMLGFLLVGAATYLAVRRFSRPVEDLARSADRLASGDMEADLPVVPDYEVGQLSLAIKRLRDAMVERLAQVRGEHALLASMKEGMEEGLILVGPDRRVLLCNRAALRILGVRLEAEGRLLGEVIRHPDLVEAIEDCMSTGTFRKVNVTDSPGRDRSFEVRLRAVEIAGSTESGVLLLFLDMTQVEALERVRRQFVADVSHELRTPVTGILAAAETLRDPDLAPSDTAQRFLATIERQARRMAALVEDLADLSRIETGAVKLDLEDVALAPLVQEVVETASTGAHAALVRIESEVPDDLVVHCDRRRMEQILVNLVDNAIKFNRRDGTVSIRAGREGDWVRIEVEDTGVGIPAASLGQVFQRFYQVDPARERGSRGSGLGLAIVKHLVRLHGGTIGVDSTVGVGTRFDVRLPGGLPEPAPAAR